MWVTKGVFMLVVSIWSDNDGTYHSYQIFIPVNYDYFVSFSSFCRRNEVNGCIVPNFERMSVRVLMEMEFARVDDLVGVSQTILDDKDFIGDEEIYVFGYKNRAVHSCSKSELIGTTIDDIISLSPAMADENAENLVHAAYEACEGDMWTTLPWSSHDLTEKFIMKAHFVCFSVNNEPWIIGGGLEYEIAELFLPCPSGPSACNINNAEIIGSYLKLRLMEAKADGKIEELIEDIETDFNSFLGVSSSYDINHYTPTIFRGNDGFILTSHHRAVNVDHFWEYHSIYHNLSLQEATSDYVAILDVSHSNVGGGWTIMHIRHEIDEVVQEHVVYAQDAEDIIINISFENAISHKTPYASIDQPEPNVISLHKQVIGEVSTDLSLHFDETMDLLNQGKFNHLFIEPFIIEHSEQKIIASGSDKLRRQSVDDVFLTDVESDMIEGKSFFFGGLDEDALMYLNDNNMFQYTDHARAFTDLNQRVYYGAEHANVFMVKKSMIPPSMLLLLSNPLFKSFHDISKGEYVPVIAYSYSLLRNKKLYFVVSLMPLAIPSQRHDCNFDFNTNCNRINNGYMTVMLSVMLELVKTTNERDFALKYFTYGFGVDENVLLGGSAKLNARVMVFDMKDNFPIVSHYDGETYTNQTFIEYEDDFLIDTEDSLDYIFNTRARQSHGTYFRYSFGDDSNQYIGLATLGTSIVEHMDDHQNDTTHLMNHFVFVVAYPDVDAIMNMHCPATSNMICVQNNAEYSLGRIQSLFLPILDESEKDFKSATLTNGLDRNGRMGKSTGLDIQIIDDFGRIYTSTVLESDSYGITYYDYFGAVDTDSIAKVDSFLEELFESSLHGDDVVSLSWFNGANYVAGSYYTGIQMHGNDDQDYANVVCYTNEQSPLTPVHSFEVENQLLSSHMVHNIQSFMGSAVQYVLQGSSMEQIGILFNEARAVGITSIIIYWDYDQGESVPSIIFKSSVEAINEEFGIKETNLVKIPSTSPLLHNIIPEVEWNQYIEVSLEKFPESHWRTIGWEGIDYFWNFQRTFETGTGNSMTIGFAVIDAIGQYDESCPIEEASPCSESVMEALISIIVRNALLFDTQSMFTIASNELLRPDGGMSVIIWETEGRIIYNTIDFHISGLTHLEWEEKWEMPGATNIFHEETNFDSLLDRVPIHTLFKFGKDEDFIPIALLVDTVTISTTQLSFAVLHKIKSVAQYDIEYKMMSENGEDGRHYDEPDFCASFFNHECSEAYAEYLISKIYEGLVSLNFNEVNLTNNTLSQHIRSLDDNLRKSVLPTKFPILDYDIYIVDGNGYVLGAVNDDDEKSRLDHIYGVSHSAVYPIGANIPNALRDTGNIIRFGNIYDPYNGISSEVYWQSSIDYGCLPNGKDRWEDLTIQDNLKQITSKQHIKTFLIDGVTYVLILEVSGKNSNTKCSEGCPIHSHCAADGMFCVCDDETVWPDSSVFECKPLYVLQSPPKVRFYFYVAFAISIIITFGVSALLFVKRRTRLMRLSSYMITQVVIVGVVMLMIGGLMFALPPDDYPSVCWQRPFWMITGLAVSLLALFLKTWRIQRLVNNVKMKRMKLNNNVLIKYMLMVMTPILILLSLWLFVFYPDFGHYSLNVLPYENKRYAVCTERTGLASSVGLYLVSKCC
eukprot:TRINITY_DN2934_c0_g1_i3.p1 TRINITY_DN2934_c0_g1~~TRINITY_DN2934_c0_g1_i3.p1  ORF type:complete len:1777 (-),score=392.67 TRINITY_DN2934_c0_g1_i3:1770-6677(-)